VLQPYVRLHVRRKTVAFAVLEIKKKHFGARLFRVKTQFFSRVCAPFAALWLLLLGVGSLPVHGAPLTAQMRARLAAGQPTNVIVEVDVAAADRTVNTERTGRHLGHDDPAILAIRAQLYADAKSAVESAVAGSGATKVRDFTHFPLSVWRLTSTAALSRIEAYPGVHAVHQNLVLRPVSVSDLAFINQPQAAAAGAKGAGTTISVIDGGLVANWPTFADFGSCTDVAVPATCRVVFDKDYYSGAQASAETTHGTNVAAIALGVAPGANLMMFDVFQGASASSTDVIDALNTAISNQATYNVVAVNLSLGDGSSNASQCPSSVFAAAMTATLNAGIQPVVAAGNNGSKTGLGDPACVPGVVSVGAVYDGAYGTITWGAPADDGGQCTDSSAADHVTCFSQSASYLSILAPGTFVNAPNSSFQQSGTSQATPHVAGSFAVLRAKYPSESFAGTLQRLQVSGVTDTDSLAGRSTPRINLLAAVNQPTSVSLSGSGPTAAAAGATGTYTITVTNNGPLAATNVGVVDYLPPAGAVKSLSSGCTANSGVVTCSAGSLAVGASMTFTITVTWTASGPVYDGASVKTDQINSSHNATIAFGNPPAPPVISGDAPLPLWAYALLGMALLFFGSRRLPSAAS